MNLFFGRLIVAVLWRHHASIGHPDDHDGCSTCDGYRALHDLMRTSERRQIPVARLLRLRRGLSKIGGSL